ASKDFELPGSSVAVPYPHEPPPRPRLRPFRRRQLRRNELPRALEPPRLLRGGDDARARRDHRSRRASLLLARSREVSPARLLHALAPRLPRRGGALPLLLHAPGHGERQRELPLLGNGAALRERALVDLPARAAQPLRDLRHRGDPARE